MGQALYRKYRLKRLDEMVGQEHVTTTLANALKGGRISHAYLLSGPRGTGKTSIARILAHEINGLPYDNEAHLDIIEIDAASNRRIDEIRDLRERVNIAPASAKYKVYIIDEVHMLTKEAFNALLKTLEEPPAHVVFILATTEAHKLPETIISRTQRYSLRPVPEDQVVQHLQHIAKKEKIAIDDDALTLVARHGEGSFRDSISLLDQASNAGEHVTRADVERILGMAPETYIAGLSAAVGGGDTAAIVTTLHGLHSQGFEPAMVAQQLGAFVRAGVLSGQSANTQASLELLGKLLDVPAARNPGQLLEIVLLQAALPAGSSTAAPQTAPAAEPAPEATKPIKAKAAAASTAEPEPQPGQTKSAPGEIPPAGESAAADSPAGEPAGGIAADDSPAEKPGGDTPTASETDITELWQQTLEAIKKQYNTLYGIARMAQPDFDGRKLTLAFKFAFHQKRLNETKNRKLLGDVIEKLYGRPVEIVCIIAEAPAAEPATKPDMTAISSIFGSAELMED